MNHSRANGQMCCATIRGPSQLAIVTLHEVSPREHEPNKLCRRKRCAKAFAEEIWP